MGSIEHIGNLAQSQLQSLQQLSNDTIAAEAELSSAVHILMLTTKGLLQDVDRVEMRSKMNTAAFSNELQQIRSSHQVNIQNSIQSQLEKPATYPILNAFGGNW